MRKDKKKTGVKALQAIAALGVATFLIGSVGITVKAAPATATQAEVADSTAGLTKTQIEEIYRKKLNELAVVNNKAQAEAKETDDALQLAKFNKAYYEALVLAASDDAARLQAQAKVNECDVALKQAEAANAVKQEAAKKAQADVDTVMKLAGDAKKAVAAEEQAKIDALMAQQKAKEDALAAQQKAQAEATTAAQKAKAEQDKAQAEALAAAQKAQAEAAAEAARLAALGNPADKDEKTKEQARKFVADATTLWKDANPVAFETYNNKYVIMNGIRYNLVEIGDGFTTSYKTSGANRSNNVQRASASLNGRVVFPGQTLSYDKSLGPRTAQNGYKIAGIFINGEHGEGMGGGICQVSSTLYNAVLNDNLTVVERHSHSLPVGYVPKGKDATVSSGAMDFRFRNDYPLPVCVLSWTENKTVSVKIMAVEVPQ